MTISSEVLDEIRYILCLLTRWMAMVHTWVRIHARTLPRTVSHHHHTSDAANIKTIPEVSEGGQNPRNHYRTVPGIPPGFSAGRISVYTEIPDVVFPLGEAAGFSTISNHDEYFPVAVSVMAVKGCDSLLTKLAIDLVEARLIKTPNEGGTLNGDNKILMRSAFEEVRQ